jgi:broad specificity phosphatase PhoE
VGRHFKDIDDLRLNRDGSLDYSENLDFEAEKIADEILEKTLENDKNIISFVISPKKRTLETTELIIKKIKEKNTKIKCLVKEQESIRELDQGEYILNSDYENGNVVGELSLANDIY